MKKELTFFDFLFFSLLLHTGFILIFSIKLNKQPEKFIWLNYVNSSFKKELNAVDKSLKKEFAGNSQRDLEKGADFTQNSQEIAFSSAGYCPPKIIFQEKLIYPEEALLKKKTGRVLVKVFISEKGVPLTSELVESSGCPELDKSALEQVLRWQYQSAFCNGEPVASKLQIPVKFVLD